jgi:hypothetical protein
MKEISLMCFALASLCAQAGGTPTFSVTVWRGETAYVEIPADAGHVMLEKTIYPLDGVSLSIYCFDDVAYETAPGGKGMRSRPDVLRKLHPGSGKGLESPAICRVSAAPDAKPGRRVFGRLEVTVVDRALPPPAKWKYSLDLWQHPWAVARYFNVKPFSDQHLAKMMPILRTLADCGCKTLTVTLLDRPWNGQCHDAYGSMVTRTKKADGSWSFDYSTFDRYVDMGRRCGVGPDIACYTMCPWGWMAAWCDADGKLHREKLLPGTPEFEDYWGDFLVDFASHLRSKGWFDDTYIAMDEREPEDVRKVVELVARKAPGMKISMAGNRKPSDFKDIAIDNYSQSLHYLTKDFFDELAPRREKGWRTTIYVCCTERRPNTFMESGADEGFWLGAYPYMAGFDGFLRWAANSWPEDPYRDASFKTASWRAGDTFLVYPEGEMSSRLLDLRRGVVAAEKLRIMREADEVTDAEIAEVVSRYGWLGAQAGKFDYGKFRSEVESLVSRPASRSM